jgi:hypothetical protein
MKSGIYFKKIWFDHDLVELKIDSASLSARAYGKPLEGVTEF